MIDGANRNDVRLLEPTIEAVAATGLLPDIETLAAIRADGLRRSEISDVIGICVLH